MTPRSKSRLVLEPVSSSLGLFSLSSPSSLSLGMFLKSPVIFFFAIACLFTMRSLCRFVGSVIRNRRMVKAYSILVWLCFFASLALTGFTFYLVFSKSSLVQCYDKDLKEVPCNSVFTAGRKIGFVISNVIGLLIQLCKLIFASSPVRGPSNPLLSLS